MAQSFTTSIELALPASRLWAALKSLHMIFPHLAPGAGDTMEVVEGKAGEPGSVTKMSLAPTEGGPVSAFFKERLESIDDEKFIALTKEIEGGHLALGFTKWQTTTKLIPIGAKKVKMEITVEYDCDPTCPVCDLVLEQNQEGIPLLFKAVEAYIISKNIFKSESLA